MAATNSAFEETRDEDLYNHLELFNMPSSSIEAPAANDYQDCREQQPTGNIGKGRRMFSDYRTEPNNEHLYCNIQSINKPSSPATESQAANQTSQDDRKGQQPTGKTEPNNEHLYLYSIRSINKPSSLATESQAANQTSQDDRRGQQPTGNSNTMLRRVLSAMIAVLALVFLAMLASLIALKWELVKSRGTNGNVLDRYGMIFSNSGRPKAIRNRSPYLANF